MDLDRINLNMLSKGASRGIATFENTVRYRGLTPMNTKTRNTKNQPTKAEAIRFTPQQVERSVFKALAPALVAKGGSAHTFDDWTMSGHGVVLRLANGQEFWCTVAEAGY